MKTKQRHIWELSDMAIFNLGENLMRRFRCCFVLLLLLCSLLASSVSAVEWINSLLPAQDKAVSVQLVVNEKPAFVILLPAKPDQKEKKAAELLANGLKVLTGLEFSVAQEPCSNDGSYCSIGKTELLKKVYPESGTVLALEEYQIQVAGKNIFLTGGKRRGPMFAVMALLEEDFGWRRYSRFYGASSPGGLVTSATVAPRRFEPTFEMRDPFQFETMTDREWALQNRLNRSQSQFPEEWGGNTSFADGFFVHTYSTLVPSEKYFAAHPEYFSYIEGRRVPNHQLCITNSDLPKIIAERVIEVAGKQPGKLIAVSQNDGSEMNWCECDACQAAIKKYGSIGGVQLNMFREINKYLPKDFSERMVTEAYFASAAPPQSGTEFPEHLLIRLCLHERIVSSYSLLPLSNDTREMMEKWAKIANGNLLVWDYAADFGDYLWPRAGFSALESSLDFYASIKGRGVLMQGPYQTTGAGLANLRAWFLARKMWDSSLRKDELIADFCTGYFGPAAEDMQRYISLLEEEEKAFLKYYTALPEKETKPKKQKFSERFMSSANDIFAEARNSAAGDKEILDRIDREWCSLLFYRLDQGPVDEKDKSKYIADIKELRQLCKKFNITQFEETPGHMEDNFVRWNAKLTAANTDSIFSYGSFRPGGDVLTLAEDANAAAKIVMDKDAVDGTAILQPLSTPTWSVQWYINNSEDFKKFAGKRVRLRVRARATTQLKGVIATAGVFNNSARSNLAVRPIQGQELSFSEYRWLDIGDFDVSEDWSVVYLAPANLQEKVDWKIDTVELVPISHKDRIPSPYTRHSIRAVPADIRFATIEGATPGWQSDLQSHQCLVVKQPLSTGEWTVQWDVEKTPQTNLPVGKKVMVRVHLRAGKIPSRGKVASLGVYDKISGTVVAEKNVKATDISGKEYRWINLPPFMLNTNSIIVYSAPAGLPGGEHWFIDAVEMIASSKRK